MHITSVEPPRKDKSEQSAELAADVEKFLANGGEIDKNPVNVGGHSKVGIEKAGYKFGHINPKPGFDNAKV